MLFSHRSGAFQIVLCTALGLSLLGSNAHAQTLASLDTYSIHAQAAAAAPHIAAVPVIQASTLSPEMKGDLLLARGEYAAALDVLDPLQPKSAITWNKMGVAYHHLFAMDKALFDYRQAVSLDPHYAEAYNNLGAIYYSQRNYALAERTYKRALKYQPVSASTYSNLGTLYFAEFKYKKGVRAYQRAFEIDPQIFSHDRRRSIDEPASREQRMATAFYMAEVYANAGRKDEALEALRRALADGFSDRKRLLEDKELASVRDLPEFHQMLVDGHLE